MPETAHATGPGSTLSASLGYMMRGSAHKRSRRRQARPGRRYQNRRRRCEQGLTVHSIGSALCSSPAQVFAAGRQYIAPVAAQMVPESQMVPRVSARGGGGACGVGGSGRSGGDSGGLDWGVPSTPAREWCGLTLLCAIDRVPSTPSSLSFCSSHPLHAQVRPREQSAHLLLLPVHPVVSARHATSDSSPAARPAAQR